MLTWNLLSISIGQVTSNVEPSSFPTTSIKTVIVTKMREIAVDVTAHHTQVIIISFVKRQVTVSSAVDMAPVNHFDFFSSFLPTMFAHGAWGCNLEHLRQAWRAAT